MKAIATGRPGSRLLLLVAILCLGSVARAEEQDTPDGAPSETARLRFPQPVVVGALLGRAVLEPLESQPVLGHVERIVRQGNGAIKVVIRYGGVLGFGSRPIAVPLEAMVLLGADMEVVDLKPAQLAALATFNGDGTTALSNDATIKVGLARPSH